MGLDHLAELRKSTVTPVSCGLPDKIVEAFLATSPLLNQALEEAVTKIAQLNSEFPELSKTEEKDLLTQLPSKFLNFYPQETTSPYVPIAARGPWIITIGGGVVYDTGGYGMLGLGHNPAQLEDTLGNLSGNGEHHDPEFLVSGGS